MTTSVGVVVVGHGSTASDLVEAARHILPPEAFDGVIAVDAGEGESPELSNEVCAALKTADQGRGVLLVVDLVGSSPCNCAKREADGSTLVTLSGLNLAMLVKLGSLDRTVLGPLELAEAAADSTRRAVTVDSERRRDLTPQKRET